MPDAAFITAFQGYTEDSPVENGSMNRLLGIAVSLIFLFSAPHAAWAGDGNAGAVQAELEKMLSGKWNAYATAYTGFKGGLSLLITSPAGEFFAQTGFESPAAPYSHFRAASTTKTFTASAIMLLHQQGKLDINHPVTQNIPGTDRPYLPDSGAYNIPYKSEITIKLLLQHRAGVFDVTNTDIPAHVDAPYAGMRYTSYVTEILKKPFHTFTFDELTGVVAAHGLSYFEPNAKYHYSNTGYGLLGKIIERVSGLSYEEFIKQNLFLPNGLLESSLPWEGTDVTLPEPFIDGYTFFGGIFYPTTEDNMSANVAEGNLITTPIDLSSWAEKLFTGRAGLKPETVSMMTQVIPTYEEHQYYGLGIVYTPGLGYGHNGGHLGYFTVMRYDPEDGVTVVLSAGLINAEDLPGQMAACYDIARLAKLIVNAGRRYR